MLRKLTDQLQKALGALFIVPELCKYKNSETLALYIYELDNSFLYTKNYRTILTGSFQKSVVPLDRNNGIRKFSQEFFKRACNTLGTVHGQIDIVYV